MMLWLCLFLVALAASAMFAGSETGFYGLNRLRLRQSGSRSWSALLLVRISASASGFLAALLIGNNFANSLAVQGASQLLTAWGLARPELWATVALTPLLLLLGELIPKAWMFHRPQRLLYFALPLALCRLLFLPLTLPLAWLARRLEGSEGQAALERRQLEGLLHEGSLHPPGEARVMAAALRALDSRGQGLAPFLRVDLPILLATTKVEAAQRQLAGSPDGIALVRQAGGRWGLIKAHRLLEAPPRQSLGSLATELPVLPAELDLGAALLRLRSLGAAFALVPSVGPPAVLDLEYAVARLILPRPEAPNAMDHPS